MAAGVSIGSLRVIGFTCLSLLLVETAGLQGVPYHVTDIASSDRLYQVAGVHLHNDVLLPRHRRQAVPGSDATPTPSSSPSTPVPSTTAVPTTTTTIPSTSSTTTSTTTSPSTSMASSTTRPSNAGPTTTKTSAPTTEEIEEIIKEEKDHPYYTTKVVRGDEASEMWRDLSTEDGSKVTKHSTLSNSHRTAATTQISFAFPFYGHTVNRVTIATGGFIYMSNFLHQWLTATQYVAPLMANFDTQIGEMSHIYYTDDGSTFAVQWDSVYLQDHQKGAFSFQAILHKTGEIRFVYKQIPVKLSTVPSNNHPVKVGVSDAYYMDQDIGAQVRRRTIYEYNRVSIDFNDIANNTAVVILPKQTCIAIKDCKQCIQANISFECQWCPEAGRCSDGLDRKRQDWLQRSCHESEFKAIDECSKYPFRDPNTLPDVNGADRQMSPAGASGKKGIGIGPIMIIILSIALIALVVGWFVYAYKNPNSRSGMWLIAHRPSALKAKLSDVRFWKRGGDSGEKYEVSMQPEGESVA